MDWKRHLPLAIATAVIVVTAAVCTYLLLGALDELGSSLVSIDVNTGSTRR